MKKMVRENVTNSFTLDPVVGFSPSIIKKKRSLPGTPDPEAEVIALSPQTLMATNRFLCEICGRGFQRDQNLQLHRRGHNVPWKLRQRSTKEVKKRVYVCPEKTCVHHQPLRALGDLTGIKKHYCRKHGEKKWKCEKCTKRYAVQSDWKSHLKTCGTKEYKCDCGTIFSRRDSFHTHRAFCVALAEETARVTATSNIHNIVTTGAIGYHNLGTSQEPNMFRHFSSFPKPIPSENYMIPRVSLWMEQGSQVSDLSQSNLIQSMSLGILYGDPFTSCMNTEQSNYQVDWAHGSKLSTISTEELTSASPLVSAPSLYSTQHNTYQASQVSLSATALLQKAAQIGATSKTPSLLMNFGVKANNIHAQNGNKYSESSGSNTMFTSHGTDADYTSEYDISAMNLWQMYPSKRHNIVKDSRKEGETRDFLGVGVEAICTSSSINRNI